MQRIPGWMMILTLAVFAFSFIFLTHQAIAQNPGFPQTIDATASQTPAEDSSSGKASTSTTPLPLKLEKKAVEALRKGKILLNFEDIDIRSLTKLMAELTGKNLILDDRVKGKISIISTRKVSVGEAWDIYKSALEASGFGLLDRGTYYKVVPAADAKQESTKFIGARKAQLKEEYVVAMILLKNADADSMEKSLRPLLSNTGFLAAYNQANALIVSDTAANVQRLSDVVQRLDERFKKSKLKIYHPKYAKVRDLATSLQAVFQDKEASVKVTAYEPTNALLVMAYPSIMPQIDKALQSLDTEKYKTEEKRTYKVYYLENADAEALAKILTEMMQERKRVEDEKARVEGRTDQSISDKQISTTKVSADKSTNSLILYCTDAEYKELKGLIALLDATRRQVLVSALISEVSLKKLREIGTNFQVLGTKGGVAFQGGLSQEALYNVLASGNFIIGGISEKSHDVKVGGTTVKYPDVFGLLQVLLQDSSFNILAAPRLLTLDHEEANITVGQVAPFATGVKFDAVGQPVVTYDYKQVGLNLKVIPHVSQSEFVRLELNQKIEEITDYLKPSVGAIGYVVPIVSQREVKTTVTVGDAQTIIIGGLIEKRTIDTIKKIPLLGDLPVLGNLFKHTSKDDQKTTLFIFLTPHIIDKPEKLLNITSRYNQLLESKLTPDSLKASQEMNKINLPVVPSSPQVSPTPGALPTVAPPETTPAPAVTPEATPTPTAVPPPIPSPSIVPAPQPTPEPTLTPETTK
jgi:general secretion pathway protein D